MGRTSRVADRLPARPAGGPGRATTTSTTRRTPTSTSCIADAGWWELEDRTDKRFVFVLHGRDGARRYAMITTDPDTNDRLLHLVKKQP